MKRFYCLVGCLGFYFTLMAKTPSVPPGPNLALKSLGPKISFYVSFDNEDLAASIGNGDLETHGVIGAPKFVPGKFGKALVLGKGGAQRVMYRTYGNVNFSVPGAVAFWIAPEEWLPDMSDNHLLSFLNCRDRKTGGLMLVERAGKGLVAGFYYVPGMKNAGMDFGNVSHWQPGEWHLIVLNWDRNGYAVSLDAGPLRRVEFSKPLDPADFDSEDKDNEFFLGYEKNDEESSLIDELMFFSTPLKEEEIEQLFQ